MPGGRPTSYKHEYCDEIIKFFDRDFFQRDQNGNMIMVGDEKNKKPLPCFLPTFERFAVNIGVTYQTLLNWTREHPEFFDAYKKATHIQQDILNQLGLLGYYMPGYSVFASKNLCRHPDGKFWSDRNDQTSDGEKINNIALIPQKMTADEWLTQNQAEE